VSGAPYTTKVPYAVAVNTLTVPLVFKITLTRKHTMKPPTFATVTIGLLLSGSLFAGPPAPEYKQVAPAPPPLLYGTGFYGAIDMGANVYQNRGGDRLFTDRFGDTLAISPKNDVGFFGGISSATSLARA